MKKIHLIRHAKSCWDNPQLADIDRPLNARGIKSCTVMALAIVNAGCDFTHVFCSPANRAQSTMQHLRNCLPQAGIEWQTIDGLYCFNYSSVLEWCQTVEEHIEEFVIVGHNPALTDLCNALGDESLSNLPTCGYAQLAMLTQHTWGQIDDAQFALEVLIRPKTLLR